MRPSAPPARRAAARAAAALLSALLAACAPEVHNRGNTVDAESLARIVPGKTDKLQLRALLGPPSSASDFGDEIWAYIGARTEKTAFSSEQLVSRQIVVITFDENERVATIDTLTEADGNAFELVDRTTPTAGQEITLLQQLIGNIGRFNPRSGAP